MTALTSLVASAVQVSVRSSWKKILVLMGILVVIGGVSLYLGTQSLGDHKITTSHYTRTTTASNQAAVSVSAAPSSTAGTLAIITAATGAVSALAAVGALVIPLVAKRKAS